MGDPECFQIINACRIPLPCFESGLAKRIERRWFTCFNGGINRHIANGRFINNGIDRMDGVKRTVMFHGLDLVFINHV